MRGFKYHYKLAIIGPLAKRHLNGVSLAGRSWPKIECWLGSYVLFQGMRASIAKKPYIFVIFQGRWSGPTVRPSRSAHGGGHRFSFKRCTSDIWPASLSTMNQNIVLS